MTTCFHFDTACTSTKKIITKQKSPGLLMVDFRTFSSNDFVKQVTKEYSLQKNGIENSYIFEIDVPCIQESLEIALDYNLYAESGKHQKDCEKTLLLNKWIYVFREDNTCINLKLSNEIKIPKNDQRVQQIIEVNWQSNGQYNRNLNSDNRPATIENSEFVIDTRYNNYIFVSSIQLPANRIKYYLNNKNILKKRALFISSNPIIPENWQEPIPLVLVDFLELNSELTTKLNKNIKDMDEQFQKLSPSATSDSEKADFMRLQLVEISIQLAEKIDFVRTRIHGDVLKEHLFKLERDFALFRCLVNAFQEEIVRFIDTEGYTSILDDHSTNNSNLITIQEHLAKCINIIADNPAAIDYLASKIEEDGCFFCKLVNTSFEFELYIDRSVNEIFNFHTNLLHIKIGNLARNQHLLYRKIKQQTGWALENEKQLKQLQASLMELEKKKPKTGSTKAARDFYVKKMRIKKQIIAPAITGMLSKYFRTLDADEWIRSIDFINENSDHIIYNPALNARGSINEAQLNKIALFDVEIKLLDKKIRQRHREAQQLLTIKNELQQEMLLKKCRMINIENSSVTANLRNVGFLFEAINVYFSWAEFSNNVFNNNNIDEIVVAGVNGIGACLDLAGTLNIIADKYFPNEIKNAGVATGRRIALAKINLVGAICDIICSGYTIWKCTQERKYAEAIGEAVALFGYMVGLAGTSLSLLFCSSTSAFLGISIGFGVISVVIVLIGAFIKSYFSTKALRNWADDCPFNKKIAKESLISQFESLPLQVLELHYGKLLDCLTQCECQAWIQTENKEYYGQNGTIISASITQLNLRIFPGLFLHGQSRLFIKFDCYIDQIPFAGQILDPVILKTGIIEIKPESPVPLLIDDSNLKNTNTLLDIKNVTAYTHNNESGSLEYVELCWTLDQLKLNADLGNYNTTSLKNFISNGKEFRSYQTILSEPALKMNLELRVDYFSKHHANNAFKENLTANELLFPLKFPQKKHREIIPYFKNLPSQNDLETSKTIQELGRLAL